MVKSGVTMENGSFEIKIRRAIRQTRVQFEFETDLSRKPIGGK
jgi:hypothetical protein